jgi:hypothetical protein
MDALWIQALIIKVILATSARLDIDRFLMRSSLEQRRLRLDRILKNIAAASTR